MARAAYAPVVVQVVQAIDRGGLEMMAVDLAIALRRRGAHPVIVALDEGGRLEARLRDEGVEFHLVGGAHVTSPATHVALARLFRRLRPQAVHTHHLPPLLNAVAATVVARAPRLVHTEHAFEYLETAPRLRRAMRLVSHAVDVLAVVGSQQAAFYRDVVGVSARKVRVITNGIDTDRFRPVPAGVAAARRAALGLPNGFLVGAVGRLAREKNFPMLLRAVAAARARGAALSLVLVGDGEDRPALDALADRLGITAHVHFLGWRTDVPDLLGCFDVLALTSWSEGLPLVVLEAMAAGVPVVSTPVGDLPRVLDHGRAGSIIPSDDADALADELTRLAQAPAARARLADAGRERVVAQYDHRTMVDAYLDAYGLGDRALSRAA